MYVTVTCCPPTAESVTGKLRFVVVSGSSPSCTFAASPTATVGAPDDVVVGDGAGGLVLAGGHGAALTGAESWSRKVSAGSSRLSWVVCTVTTTLAAPAAIVAVRAGLTAV